MTAMPMTSPTRSGSEATSTSARFELTIGEQQRGQEQRHQRGAREAGGEQDEYVAQVMQAGIEPHVLARHGRRRRRSTRAKTAAMPRTIGHCRLVCRTVVSAITTPANSTAA